MSTDPKTYFTDTADPGQTDFSFNFDYLEDEHVTVTIDGAATTDFTIVTSPAKKIVLDTPATGGEIVRVQRISAPDENLVDFVNGSVLTESELDRAYLHNRYLAEESAEQNDISLRVKTGATGSFDALNKKIVNVSDPTDEQDAATKNYVDGVIGDAVLGTVPDDSITYAKIQDVAANNVLLGNDNGAGEELQELNATEAKTLLGLSTVATSGSYNDLSDKPSIGTGTVTSVGSGTGLTGGPITTSGTLSLANTAVTAGSYTNTNLTVDAQGRITAASNGTSGSAGTPNYSTGWFNNTTGLANGGTYSFTHNLGTTNLTATIWVADDASGTNAQEVRNYFHANASAEYGAVLTSISTTSTTLQLLQDGWIAINSSGVGPGLSIAGGESWSGHYVKVVLSASATVGAVSKYTAAWATSHGGVTVANGATLSITHNLGTSDVIVQAYVNSSASDVGALSLDSTHEDDSGFTPGQGAVITSIQSANAITVQLGTNGYYSWNSSGVMSGATFASKYIKVVVIG